MKEESNSAVNLILTDLRDFDYILSCPKIRCDSSYLIAVSFLVSPRGGIVTSAALHKNSKGETGMDRRKFIASTTAVGAGSAALLVTNPAYAAQCAAPYAPALRKTSPDERLQYPLQVGEDPMTTDTTWPPGHVNRSI